MRQFTESRRAGTPGCRNERNRPSRPWGSTRGAGVRRGRHPRAGRRSAATHTGLRERKRRVVADGPVRAEEVRDPAGRKASAMPVIVRRMPNWRAGDALARCACARALLRTHCRRRAQAGCRCSRDRRRAALPCRRRAGRPVRARARRRRRDRQSAARRMRRCRGRDDARPGRVAAGEHVERDRLAAEQLLQRFAFGRRARQVQGRIDDQQDAQRIGTGCGRRATAQRRALSLA